jgi:hypothetical protein
MYEILGYLFSNLFSILGFIAVIVIISVWLSNKKPFKTERANKIYTKVCIGIGMGLVVFPLFSSLGFARGFDSIKLSSKHIILAESRSKGTGTKKHDITRFYILDRITGQRIYRKHIFGQATICASHGDTLLLKNMSLFSLLTGKYQLIDVNDFSTIKVLSEKNLIREFPELNPGIDDIAIARNISNEKDSYCLTIYSKNGKSYSYLPFENKLTEGNYYYPASAGNYSDRRFSLFKTTVYWNADPNNEIKYELGGGNGKVRSLFLNKKVIKKAAYLGGEFMDFDTISKGLTIRHFFDTDEEDFMLVRLDSGYKECWSLDKTSAQLKDAFSADWEELNVFARDETNFYFNSGGFVVCVNKISGQIKWKTRL